MLTAWTPDLLGDEIQQGLEATDLTGRLDAVWEAVQHALGDVAAHLQGLTRDVQGLMGQQAQLEQATTQQAGRQAERMADARVPEQARTLYVQHLPAWVSALVAAVADAERH